ncbi:HAD family hydrolase [Amycolatopsis magusensis]|uniref:HAD family hydrolase n=1 Tax=Amycolatopsis magusensis TaxID=882444 RepID=UPI0037927D1D
MIEPGRSLIFDADDTLWENNVLFERALDDFIAWVAHPSLAPPEIRRRFAAIQTASIPTHGYGAPMFQYSLGRCFEELTGRPAGDAEHAGIADLCAALSGHKVELIPGVAATLEELRHRHRLYLLTKGSPEPQQRKIDASGLAPLFKSVHIVAEKDAATYRRFTTELGIAPEDGWMIGNSVKSDILPARAVGLNAVFLPNEHTWELEHAELDDEHVLELTAFPELLAHF